MKIKQHTLEQPLVQRKKSKRKLKNILRQQKWKHNTPNLWDAAKAILKGKFIEINACVKKEKRFQINNLPVHIKKLGKGGTS